MNKRDWQLRFHKFQQSREKYFAPKFYKALKSQYISFVKNYRGDKNEALLTIPYQPIYNVLKVLYLDAGTVYGKKVAASLPHKPRRTKARGRIGFDEHLIELINRYFETEILETSQGITETTREQISVILQIANEEGRSIDWVVDQLLNESDDLNYNRAKLIARTETVTAANKGAILAAKESGLLMLKEWLATLDNRTRPDHLALNGIKVGMDTYFHVGGDTMQQPGDKVQQNGLATSAGEVCNCRCTVIFEPVRDSRGRLIEYDYGL